MRTDRKLQATMPAHMGNRLPSSLPRRLPILVLVLAVLACDSRAGRREENGVGDANAYKHPARHTDDEMGRPPFAPGSALQGLSFRSRLDAAVCQGPSRIAIDTLSAVLGVAEWWWSGSSRSICSARAKGGHLNPGSSPDDGGDGSAEEKGEEREEEEKDEEKEEEEREDVGSKERFLGSFIANAIDREFEGLQYRTDQLPRGALADIIDSAGLRDPRDWPRHASVRIAKRLGYVHVEGVPEVTVYNSSHPLPFYLYLNSDPLGMALTLRHIHLVKALDRITTDDDRMQCLRQILGVYSDLEIDLSSVIQCKFTRPKAAECAYCLLTTWDVDACCGTKVKCLPTLERGSRPATPEDEPEGWEVVSLWGDEDSLSVCDYSLPTTVEYALCFLKVWDDRACRAERCFDLEYVPELGVYERRSDG